MLLNRLTTLTILLTALSAPAEQMALGTNFWDVSWGNGMADPFTDGWNHVSGDDPWSRVFIEETKFYTTFRFMDWGKVNNTSLRRWSERTRKSDPVQYPVAYEWMIDICNKMGKDMWVCVPHITDGDYVRNLARLIYETLDPSLRCWVEHSNETWNDQFSQAKHCQEQGLALGYGSNRWYAGQEYHARVSMQIFEIFEEVFADSRHRLVTVMGGTHVHAFAETHYNAITGSANPGVTVDAYALAPYVGNGISGTTPNLYNEMVAAMVQLLPRVARISAMYRAAGITMVTYEGGQHILDNAMVASRNEQMYDFYRTYLDTMSSYFDLMMHYCAAGASWGAKERHGEPDAIAPKYRALLDYSIAIGQYDPETGQIVAAGSSQPGVRTRRPNDRISPHVVVGAAGGRALQPKGLLLLNGSRQSPGRSSAGVRIVPRPATEELETGIHSR